LQNYDVMCGCHRDNVAILSTGQYYEAENPFLLPHTHTHTQDKAHNITKTNPYNSKHMEIIAAG